MTYDKPSVQTGTKAGLALRAWRASLGLTQRQFAESLVPPARQKHVSGWETGRITPSMRRAVALEELTGGAVAVKEWFMR